MGGGKVAACADYCAEVHPSDSASAWQCLTQCARSTIPPEQIVAEVEEVRGGKTAEDRY